MSSSEPSWPFVVNLSNSIIGVSMLALPYCMEECGILLGCALVLGTAYLTRLSCFLLLRSSQYGRRKSYETLAVATYGPVGKLLVEISMIGLLLGTCTAFFVIIGDLAPAIVAKIFGFQETPSLRAALLISLAVAVVLPLSLKNNINALTGFSTASLLFYAVFVILVVYFSLPTLFAGDWYGSVVWYRPSGTFAVLPILSLAFSCQAQVFVLYEGLQDPSVKKMTTIVNSAVNLVTVAYLTVGVFAYITYYDRGVSGDVLNNFQPGILTQVLKLAFALSVLIGYPLMVFPCRLSINSLLTPEVGGENIPGGALMIPPLQFRIITICIVGSTLTVAVIIPNVEFILQLSGCVMGSLICYVFPGVMFLRLCSATDPDKWKALFVAVLGVIMLLVCTMTVVTTVPGEHRHSQLQRPEIRPIARPQGIFNADGHQLQPPGSALRRANATLCKAGLLAEECAKLQAEAAAQGPAKTHDDKANERGRSDDAVAGAAAGVANHGGKLVAADHVDGVGGGGGGGGDGDADQAKVKPAVADVAEVVQDKPGNAAPADERGDDAVVRGHRVGVEHINDGIADDANAGGGEHVAVAADHAEHAAQAGNAPAAGDADAPAAAVGDAADAGDAGGANAGDAGENADHPVDGRVKPGDDGQRGGHVVEFNDGVNLGAKKDNGAHPAPRLAEQHNAQQDRRKEEAQRQQQQEAEAAADVADGKQQDGPDSPKNAAAAVAGAAVDGAAVAGGDAMAGGDNGEEGRHKKSVDAALGVAAGVHAKLPQRTLQTLAATTAERLLPARNLSQANNHAHHDDAAVAKDGSRAEKALRDADVQNQMNGGAADKQESHQDTHQRQQQQQGGVDSLPVGGGRVERSDPGRSDSDVFADKARVDNAENGKRADDDRERRAEAKQAGKRGADGNQPAAKNTADEHDQQQLQGDVRQVAGDGNGRGGGAVAAGDGEEDGKKKNRELKSVRKDSGAAGGNAGDGNGGKKAGADEESNAAAPAAAAAVAAGNGEQGAGEKKNAGAGQSDSKDAAAVKENGGVGDAKKHDGKVAAVVEKAADVHGLSLMQKSSAGVVMDRDRAASRSDRAHQPPGISPRSPALAINAIAPLQSKHGAPGQGGIAKGQLQNARASPAAVAKPILGKRLPISSAGSSSNSWSSPSPSNSSPVSKTNVTERAVKSNSLHVRNLTHQQRRDKKNEGLK